MPHFVNIPGHGKVKFPDTMSDQDIVIAVKKLSLPEAPPLTEATEKSFAQTAGETAADAVTGAQSIASIADPLVAGGAALLSKYLTPYGNRGQSLKDQWKTEMEGLRKSREEALSRSPVGYVGGALSSGIANASAVPTLLSNASKGLPLAARMAAGVGDAAGFSAASAAGSNLDQNPGQAALEAGTSKWNLLGAAPALISDGVRSLAAKRAVTKAYTNAGVRELGIPLKERIELLKEGGTKKLVDYAIDKGVIKPGQSADEGAKVASVLKENAAQGMNQSSEALDRATEGLPIKEYGDVRVSLPEYLSQAQGMISDFKGKNKFQASEADSVLEALKEKLSGGRTSTIPHSEGHNLRMSMDTKARGYRGSGDPEGNVKTDLWNRLRGALNEQMVAKAQAGDSEAAQQWLQSNSDYSKSIKLYDSMFSEAGKDQTARSSLLHPMKWLQSHADPVIAVGGQKALANMSKMPKVPEDQISKMSMMAKILMGLGDQQ